MLHRLQNSVIIIELKNFFYSRHYHVPRCIDRSDSSPYIWTPHFFIRQLEFCGTCLERSPPLPRETKVSQDRWSLGAQSITFKHTSSAIGVCSLWRQVVSWQWSFKTGFTAQWNPAIRPPQNSDHLCIRTTYWIVKGNPPAWYCFRIKRPPQIYDHFQQVQIGLSHLNSEVEMY